VFKFDAGICRREVPIHFSVRDGGSVALPCGDFRDGCLLVGDTATARLEWYIQVWTRSGFPPAISGRAPLSGGEFDDARARLP
jgi:hypothetical protein